MTQVNLSYSVNNPATSPSPSVKIPLDHTKFIKLYNGYESLQELVDGDTGTTPEVDWSVFVNPSVITYDFAGLRNVVIDRIRLFDIQGSMDSPLAIYAVDEYNQRTLLGSFTGDLFQSWREFTSFPPVKARYIWMIYPGAWGNLGERTSEFEVYGSYDEDEKYPITLTPKPVLFDDLAGSNIYEWNLLLGNEDEDSPGGYLAGGAPLIAKLGIVRHYLDWSRVETNTELSMRLNPEQTGGWYLDAMYKWLHEQGIKVHVCLQDTPQWMQNLWPSGQREGKNAPVKYPGRFDNPASYINQAMVGFNIAARYGNNSDINPSYIHIDTSQPSENWLKPNTVKLGLGYVHTIECGNETNRFWMGRNAYQTAREHAANLSAFYDGHKNTLGEGIGVKSADPDMLVSTQGSVDTGYEYFRGVIDWCKQYRGYREDGSVDVPFDIIHYHRYNNDTNGHQGNSTTGVCPEISGFYEDTIRLRYLMQEFCPHVKIMLGETGYDYNQSSIQKAPPIGSKTSLQVIGDWNIRTILEAARSGTDYLTFYQLYDDTNLAPSTTYATCGIASESGYANRPTLAYIAQMFTFMQGYEYRETISELPRVTRWSDGSDDVYAIWSPTQSDESGNYSLEFGSLPVSINRYEMNGVNDIPTETSLAPASYIDVQYSETPVFIKASL